MSFDNMKWAELKTLRLVSSINDNQERKYSFHAKNSCNRRVPYKQTKNAQLKRRRKSIDVIKTNFIKNSLKHLEVK